MNQKYLVRVWIALVLLTTVSAIYLILPNPIDNPQTTKSDLNSEQSSPPSGTATNTLSPAEKRLTEANIASKQPAEEVERQMTTTTATEPIAADLEQNSLDVRIEILGQIYPLRLAEKSTAYDAMAKLVEDKKITIVFKQFIGLGYFVDEINGVKTDKNAGKYWIYHLNNKPAQMGISNYILKNNDLLTWKYEVPQF